MRLFCILCWLTLPILAWAYHVGPGQEQLALDDAAMFIRLAEYEASQDQHEQASLHYANALKTLPEGRTEDEFSVQLAMAKSQMQSGKLPEARVLLQSLMNDIDSNSDLNDDLKNETRKALASSQYYMTWLMRLEGLPAEEWEPEIEASRQNYKWLSEQAVGSEGQQHREDLEASIRLARMDLTELQALKIPCQCQCCCSGQCKKPGRKPKKKGKKKGAGAGLGKLPDGSGS